MTIEKFEIKITTAGSAGSASGSGHAATPIGQLVAMHLNFTSQPSTTDVTVTAPGNPAALTLLTLTNVNTDAWYFPKTQDHDNTGAGITGSYSDPLLHQGVDISVAQGDAVSDGLIATLYVRV